MARQQREPAARRRTSARRKSARKPSSGRRNERARNARRSGTTNTKSGAHAVVRTKPERRRVEVSPRARGLMRAGLKLSLVAGLVYGAIFGAHEAYDYATTSPRFEVRSLIFNPSEHIDDDAMRSLLGLEHGTNILALEPEELAEQVAAHPWVAEAIVLRHLPDTLEVRLTERDAKAVVLMDGFFLIDEKGQPFKRVDAGEREQLPIITGVEREALLADADGSHAKLQKALLAIDAYNEKQRPRLSEVHIEPEDGMSLYTADSGTQLRFGRTSVRRGLDRYDALRAALGARAEQLEVVHLDAELRPGARDRVVARFSDAATERSVIADAADAPQPSQPELEAAPEPLLSAPQKRRIPRY